MTQRDIIPAINCASFAQVSEQIRMVDSFAPTVQIDVSDGAFVKAYSWPYENHGASEDDGSTGGDIDDLARLATHADIELHLMVLNPEEQLHEWLAEPLVKRILVHAESTLDLKKCLETIRSARLEAGVVLKLPTDALALEPLVHLIDRIQVMGISELGPSGNPFVPAAVIKVRKLRQMYPSVTIAVDGGVSLKNAPELIHAGADSLVVGSALFKSDNIEKTFYEFAAL